MYTLDAELLTGLSEDSQWKSSPKANSNCSAYGTSFAVGFVNAQPFKRNRKDSWVGFVYALLLYGLSATSIFRRRLQGGFFGQLRSIVCIRQFSEQRFVFSFPPTPRPPLYSSPPPHPTLLPALSLPHIPLYSFEEASKTYFQMKHPVFLW